MLDRGEFAGRLGADLAAWRFDGGQLRELLFQGQELTEQGVVLGITDFRLIENIVEPVVTVDFPAEFSVTLGRGRGGPGDLQKGLAKRGCLLGL